MERKEFIPFQYKSEDHKGYSIDSFADHIADPVGAGDALLAYSTLCMISTNSLLISSILGSFAAAIACETDGNVPIKLNFLLKKISDVEKLSKNYYEK